MMILGERYDERYGLDEYDAYDPFKEDDKYEVYLDAVKDDVAYCLGIEEDSEEWWELMNI